MLTLSIISIFFCIKLSEGTFGNALQGAVRRESYARNYIMHEVRNNGYPIEEHDVLTADGYQLKLHRIPYSPKGGCKVNLPPVYIFHGLLGNSDIWLLNGPDRSLPYILADAGYDVWLGNARGTTHSRRHRTLNPNSQKFWEFTWHEIGIYDNPANIDYILRKTGQQQIHYMGHSQGTTTFFVMTSLRPEYNAKIKTMHALSPVAYMKDSLSPYFTIPAVYNRQIMFIAKKFGLTELLPNTNLIEIIQRLFCGVPNPTQNLCFQLLASAGGHNPAQYDRASLYKSFDVTPAGASIYQLLHYSQGVRTGKFQTFDYGNSDLNIRKYGYSKPVDYPVERITAPMTFFVSGNDYITPLSDINRLINGLSRKPTYIEVADKRWTHFDYIIGKNAKELVYDRILIDIQKSDGVACV